MHICLKRRQAATHILNELQPTQVFLAEHATRSLPQLRTVSPRTLFVDSRKVDADMTQVARVDGSDQAKERLQEGGLAAGCVNQHEQMRAVEGCDGLVMYLAVGREQGQPSRRSFWGEESDLGGITGALCEELEGVGDHEDPSVDVVTEGPRKVEQASIECLSGSHGPGGGRCPLRLQGDRKSSANKEWALRESVGPGVSRYGRYTWSDGD
ncbi:hypothetical protein B0T18DRAFT_212746 [Schizothecium vesticola]|uniref:Uncharacterized protein n=1 Tax=Schizothecium vesticola TaxID=314040 RepID=A0AA40EJQ3_9PEZI|nr:hypothetical protein B0T18DRAFT_212746 [Schizothecium vesticola]